MQGIGFRVYDSGFRILKVWGEGQGLLDRMRHATPLHVCMPEVALRLGTPKLRALSEPRDGFPQVALEACNAVAVHDSQTPHGLRVALLRRRCVPAHRLLRRRRQPELSVRVRLRQNVTLCSSSLVVLQRCGDVLGDAPPSLIPVHEVVFRLGLSSHLGLSLEKLEAGGEVIGNLGGAHWAPHGGARAQFPEMSPEDLRGTGWWGRCHPDAPRLHRFLEVANWAVYARHMDVATAASAHLLAAAQQAVGHSANVICDHF